MTIFEQFNATTLEQVYLALGATVTYKGNVPSYNFGIRDESYSSVYSSSEFEPLGNEWDNGQKEFIPWKKPSNCTISNSDWNRYWLTLLQETGSCVMQGAINFVRQRIVAEVLLMRQPEVIRFPNLLVAYGKSREFLGLHDRGDGSSGDTMAKALAEVGFCEDGNSLFPTLNFSETKGIHYGAKVELDFSQGRKIPSNMLEACKPHIARVVKIKSVEQGRLLLLNGYGQTVASDWGGRMQITPRGNPPVLLNDHVGVWHHQQAYIAVKHHPQFGWLYWREQSWGPNAHGYCPFFERRGGFAVLEKDYEYDIKRGQVWTASGLHGFLPSSFKHLV